MSGLGAARRRRKMAGQTQSAGRAWRKVGAHPPSLRSNRGAEHAHGAPSIWRLLLFPLRFLGISELRANHSDSKLGVMGELQIATLDRGILAPAQGADLLNSVAFLRDQSEGEPTPII